eukprot:gene3666-5053_t
MKQQETAAPTDKGTSHIMKAWDDAWAHVTQKLVPAVKCLMKQPKNRYHWISEATKALMRRRNRLRKCLDRVTDRAAAPPAVDEAAAAYSAAKKDAAQAFRSEQRAELHRLWNAAGPAALSSERWKVFNYWRGKCSQQRPEPACSADRVNEAFLNKVERVRNKLRHFPGPEFRAGGHTALSGVQRVTTEVGPELRARPASTAVGPYIAEELTAVVNDVLQGTTWPARWKDAIVQPLWKRKGDRRDPATYRPVALLPAIARLTERILHQQLKQHVQTHTLLPDCQHGFRAGYRSLLYSCATALLQIVQDVANARDSGDAVYIASLDAASAFDTVPHALLLRKLRECHRSFASAGRDRR